MAQSATMFPISSLEIESGEKRYTFTIELAVTPQQRMRGLMFRKRLDVDKGMLFDYGSPLEISMWMKNTHIPLDMVFIDGKGRISHIVERTIPLSEEHIGSEGFVRAVLELNGGTVSRLGIKRGDQVAHEIFGTAR
jgi:uncharacterized protein